MRQGKPAFSLETFRDPHRLSELVHKFGHEIGNPLTSVISYASILERFGSPSPSAPDLEKISQFASSIGSEAWKVSHSVEKLVLLLSDRSGDSATTDINQVLSKLPTRLRNRYGNASVRLDIDRADGEFLVGIDPEQLSVLLSELVLNAWEAESVAAKGENRVADPIHIRVSSAPPMAMVRIENTLAEKLPGDLSTIFDPFTKFPIEKRSLGVGLSVSAAIAMRHQGSLEVQEFEDGSGFRFAAVLSLPLTSVSSAV